MPVFIEVSKQRTEAAVSAEDKVIATQGTMP